MRKTAAMLALLIGCISSEGPPPASIDMSIALEPTEDECGFSGRDRSMAAITALDTDSPMLHGSFVISGAVVHGNPAEWSGDSLIARFPEDDPLWSSMTTFTISDDFASGAIEVEYVYRDTEECSLRYVAQSVAPVWPE